MWLKNKINEERKKMDIVERVTMEIECAEELKLHPSDMGTLINMAKDRKIKHFEFHPDFLFGRIRRKSMSFDQFHEQQEMFSDGKCY